MSHQNHYIVQYLKALKKLFEASYEVPLKKADWYKLKIKNSWR